MVFLLEEASDSQASIASLAICAADLEYKDLYDMAEEVKALSSFSILSTLSLPCCDIALALLVSLTLLYGDRWMSATILQMSSSIFLGTGTCLGSLPLFWAWISARRRAAHLEDFPYSMDDFCSFSESNLDTVLDVFCSTDVVLEDDTATEDATALAEEDVKAASNLEAVAADALFSFKRANWRP